jgi:hypothetical protein
LLGIGEILAKQQQLNKNKTVQFKLKNFSNVSGRIRKKYCDNLQRMLRGGTGHNSIECNSNMEVG